MESDETRLWRERMKLEEENKKLKKENEEKTNELGKNKVFFIILILAIFGPMILKHC